MPRSILASILFSSTVVLGAAACGGDDNNNNNSAPSQPDAGPTPTEAGTPPPTDVDAGPAVQRVELDGPVTAALHAGLSWYLGGDFNVLNPVHAPRLAAFDANGTPSATCQLGTGFDGSVGAVTQAGTSIYVGGAFTHYQGVTVNGIAKLDATTCALDTSFSPCAITTAACRVTDEQERACPEPQARSSPSPARSAGSARRRRSISPSAV